MSNLLQLGSGGTTCLSDELLKWRSEFPILEKTVYLISHSLGAMPKATYGRLHEYADAWATRGVRAWAEGWWDMPVTVGDEVAPIIGADPGTVVMHQNVSVCQSLVISCLEPTPQRNKIVYSELNFPSVMYVYEAHARDGKLRIEIVKSDDGITVPLERMLAAIDETTLLVPFSHVLFKSAFLQDAKAIIDRAHEVGAMVVLDTYQSAGTVPFSVKDLNVDFATGGSVKWLCGGPGAGYLYVRPDLQNVLEPKTTGWMAHEAPFAFKTELRYASNITRFLHGSPAIPALYAAESGYKIINEIGVEKIRQKSMRQTDYLINLAEEAGFKVTSPKDVRRRGGTVTVAHEHAAAIAKELIRREFIIDYRPGAGIRISPHFYTTDNELELVIKEMKKIGDSESYRDHETAGAAF
ncbi:MAG TPA: aminotransferase class V-fold PLP-dependent enzyme, partial [Pyrinomonadaceae bacterium]|nr:aminotransferase class V-fold PLP-dependent enzyme [Pyrinomonadaceae bacterium]